MLFMLCIVVLSFDALRCVNVSCYDCCNAKCADVLFCSNEMYAVNVFSCCGLFC